MNRPSTDTLDRAKRVVKEFIEWSGAYRDTHFEAIEEGLKHYEVKPGKTNIQTRAGQLGMADTTTHENIETVAPQTLAIVTVNGQIPFEVAPVDRDFDEAFVKGPNAIIKSDLKMSHTHKKLVEACRTVPKYGTAVYRVPWERKTRATNEPKYSEPKLVSIDESGSPIYQVDFLGYERTENVVYEGVGWEYVPWKHIWLDPFTPDVDKAQGIVEERLVAFADLRKEEYRMETTYQDDGMGNRTIIRTPTGHYLKESLDELEDVLDNEIAEKRAGNPNKDVKHQQNQYTPRKQVNIKVYHGYFDYDDDGTAIDCIITIAGPQETVIQLQPTTFPLRPYIVCRHIPLEGQTYGLSATEIMTPTQSFINGTYDQVMDNVTKILCGRWLLDEQSDLSQEDMKWSIDKILRVRDTKNELVPAVPPYVTGAGYEGIKIMKENLQQAVAAFKNLQATPMKYHTTATEVSHMAESAMPRHLMNGIVMETELIIPLLQRIVEYNHAFMPNGQKIVRLTNDPSAAERFLTVSHADLAAQWDFTVLGSTRYARQMEQRQDMVSFVQSIGMVLAPFMTNPSAMEDIMDLGLFMRELASTFNFPNLDKIFPGAGVQQPQAQPDESGEGAGMPPNPLAQMEMGFAGMGGING